MTSYGQELLKRYVLEMIDGRLIEDARPDWLMGLELDLWFPDLNISLEFQGDQHFVPVYGRDQMERQWRNDAIKGRICEQRGVALARIDASDLEFTKLKGKIRRACGKVGVSLKRNLLDNPNFHELRRLNGISKRYRLRLKVKYGSPSSFSRGPGRSEAKQSFHFDRSGNGPIPR